jgi:hypothetical protein
VDQGLITFNHLGDIDNAIPLCPLCHRNFDDINKPGLIFLPDISYFIDFEKEDYRHREEIRATHGVHCSKNMPESSNIPDSPDPNRQT